MLLPAMGKVWQKSWLAQARTDLSRTACALERYYLANGGYPETLEALAPKFTTRVPSDLMSGKPLVYRRDTAQSYVLYSVGMNLLDDGGKPAITKDRLDPDKGDWVWTQPAK
jgi:Tfp pilus assembly protein PilE